MTKAKKTALILILIGICLPTATLPFITEFRPAPELCLTSNFFRNMGNMVVVLGSAKTGVVGGSVHSATAAFSVPYRYLFSAGVVLICTGLVIMVVTAGGSSGKNSG